MHVAGDDSRQRAAETGLVGAAVLLRDVVGEAEFVGVIAVVPLQRRLDGDAVAFADDVDHVRDDAGARAVEVSNVGLDPAFVEQRLLERLGTAQILEHDAHAGIQERKLAQAMLDRLPVVLGHGEGFRRRQEAHGGAALGLAVDLRRRADELERRFRVAMDEAHGVLFAVAPDGELEPFRERVDDRDADAVEAAGNLVGILVELTAGVQLGHDDLGRRDALLRVDVGRNAAPVIGDFGAAVGVQNHLDPRGVAGQRLVDGVVDHLVDHVVETRAVVGVADIHARAFADRV